MSGSRVLWTAGLLDRPFPERLAAAAALGYRRLSVATVEAAAWLAEDPELVSAARRAADSVGVALSVLDPVVTWLPTDPRWALARAGLVEIEEIGVRLGVEALCVIAGRDHGLPHREVVRRFQDLCDLAAGHAWTAAVEFAPMSGIRTLADALGLVEASGRDNARVLFDTWHFFRGGGTIAELDSVPAGRIGFVQLSDAGTQFEGRLGRDTYRRLVPGDGDIDLEGMLRALAAVDALGAVGPEVLREGQEGRTALERAREEGRSVDTLWRRALGTGFLPGGAEH